MQGYCLDTTVFINGWRKYYRNDVFPCVWEALNQLISDGTAISCREVYEELRKKDDALFKWAKEREAAFEQPTEAILVEFRGVMSAYRSFAALGGGSTNAADPWVIAHARVGRHVIVTDEQLTHTKPTKPPKIPNVCQEMGIPCLTPVEFWAANGVVFG